MRTLRIVLCAFSLMATSAATAADAIAEAVQQEVARVMAAVEADDAAALQRSMSPYMLENASAAKLLELMRKRRMHEFRELHWNEPRHNGRIARVEGIGTLESGGRRWVQLRLVKRDDWKLAMIGIENADAIDEPAAVDVPPPDAIATLLADTMGALVEGTNKRDFTRLHALMPSNIDEQFTRDELNAGLLAKLKREDYAAALALEPVLDKPARIDDDAILWLEGHYAIEPPLRFRHGYQHERGAWRLLKFAIDPPVK